MKLISRGVLDYLWSVIYYQGMADIDLAYYKNLFIETSKKDIEDTRNNLKELSLNPQNTELIEALFIQFHTLKGRSLSVGYSQTGELAHRIETIFRNAKESGTIVSQDLVDKSLTGLDKLQKSIEKIASEGTELDLSDALNSFNKE